MIVLEIFQAHYEILLINYLKGFIIINVQIIVH